MAAEPLHEHHGPHGPAADLSAETLAVWVAPEVALHGYELVDVEVMRGGGRLTLRFSIDKPGGVTIADCTAMDRAVTQLLEVRAADVLTGRYVVEVSSPGIFRRLSSPAHFQRYLGQIVKVVTRRPEGGIDQLRGPLVAADAEAIVVVVDGFGTVRVALASIARAQLDPDLKIGRIARRRRERPGRGSGSGPTEEPAGD